MNSTIVAHQVKNIPNKNEKSKKTAPNDPNQLSEPLNSVDVRVYRNENKLFTSNFITSIKEKFLRVLEANKIYVINGPYFPLRKALLKRRWVEKLYRPNEDPNAPAVIPTRQNILEICYRLPERTEIDSEDTYRQKCEATLMLRLLASQRANLYWNVTPPCELPNGTLVNHLDRATFTNKIGLCTLLQQSSWFDEPGVSAPLIPRCYHSSSIEEVFNFIDDFRITACMSLLKNFLYKLDFEGIASVYSPYGSIPINSLIFAIDRCSEYLAFLKHEDIDTEWKVILAPEWLAFLSNHYQFVHYNKRFLEERGLDTKCLQAAVRTILSAIVQVWPQNKIDGSLNMWILKPERCSMGRGIQLMQNFEEIYPLLFQLPLKHVRYIVQKYVEKPFLIRNTKFDIRQWFLVTSVQPLIVWMYNDCYLRFSGKPYDINDWHEAVHLTNNSIQRKYTNPDKDPDLPKDNMWDKQQFIAYLEGTSDEEKWDSIIFPGMQQAIVSVLLTSQDNMVHRASSFQLYGADFVINEDFSPWLLEVNASPDMGPTTPVTSRLCAQCLEDVVKVVIDRKRNPQANTGEFKLVYKQTGTTSDRTVDLNLAVVGKQFVSRHRRTMRRFLRGIVRVADAAAETFLVEWTHNLMVTDIYLRCGIQVVRPEEKTKRGARGCTTTAAKPNEALLSIAELHAPKVQQQRSHVKSMLQHIKPKVQSNYSKRRPRPRPPKPTPTHSAYIPQVKSYTYYRFQPRAKLYLTKNGWTRMRKPAKKVKGRSLGRKLKALAAEKADAAVDTSADGVTMLPSTCDGTVNGEQA